MSAWKYFFVVAALFNFAAGAPLLVAPGEMLAMLKLPIPDDLLFIRVTGLLVTCFGVAYLFAAADPMRNRAIVITGAIGKAGVVALFTQALVQGTLPLEAFAVSMGDLAFVVGFVVFLVSQK